MRFNDIDHTKKKLHLKLFLGCGTTLFGKPPHTSGEDGFRKNGKETDRIDEYCDYSEVMYHFFTLFFLPIWPVGCYRIMTKYRHEQSFELDIHRYVIKDEEWVAKEIRQIYLHYWGIAAAIVSLLIFMLKCGGEGDY